MYALFVGLSTRNISPPAKTSVKKDGRIANDSTAGSAASSDENTINARYAPCLYNVQTVVVGGMKWNHIHYYSHVRFAFVIDATNHWSPQQTPFSNSRRNRTIATVEGKYENMHFTRSYDVCEDIVWPHVLDSLTLRYPR